MKIKKKKSHFVFYELPSDACIIRHNAPQCLLTEMNTQHQNNVHHIQLIAAPNLSLLRHRRCRRVHVCLRVKKKPAHDGAYSMSVDRGTYSRHSYEGTAHTLFKWRRAYEFTHNHWYARIVCVMHALIRINGTATTSTTIYIHAYTYSNVHVSSAADIQKK